ncbi:FMN-linked oxidoreductase [Macrolepiota fuliginosa MF-IS2]|uniref:FMN-linked oxidoreductase n=1 Tax=Macrolepiota fuliginosa MF-IS2 TaxID=1400762 RepID=A0A9P5X8R6_9AGAR|nr:FMN-linked oxidoreductase [Macrolepiota fuliginosa MF-IS2]
MASRLFQPITVGQIQLRHRVVLAPLTRLRADERHVPNLPVVKEYYTQRATVPGTLLIAEGTMIAVHTGGLGATPGIYNEAQIDAWKEIVQGVHEKDSFIFCQLWANGRQGFETAFGADDPTFPNVGPSPIAIDGEGTSAPRELTIAEIKEYIQLYATAARNAVHGAHFDGVEVHGANGFLIDQFLQDVSNQRQDDYGGSVERRSRFALEVVRAVVDATGAAEKVGIRLSPWSPARGMGMNDPLPQFAHLVSALKLEFPGLAYIHVIEPRIAGDRDHDIRGNKPHASNDFLRNIWVPKPYISAGGYRRDDAMHQADEKENELVAFGRTFISNPDLPARLTNNLPLTPYDRKTFYLSGDTSGRGYTDYPFAADSTR